MVTVQLALPDHDRRLGGLTDWFGAFSPYSLKRKEFKMSPGNILTLTSDGAQCDEHVLSDLYRRSPFVPDTLQQIVTAALRHSRSDDVSITAGRRE